MHPNTPAQLEAEIRALRERILALERRASELERAEESAKALAEVGREMAGTLDLAQATDRVVSTALRLFRVRRAVLYQLDRASGALVCVAAAGEGGATNWIGCTLPPGAGVAGMAVAAGRTVWSADLIRDTRITLPDWAVERLRQEGYRSVVGIPLTFQGEIVGALVLGDSVGRVFTDLDVRFLAAVAVQAALAVRNALLYDETQHRLRHTETLLAVSQAVSSTLDATEAMRRVARETARTLGADMAIAYLLEPDHDRLRPIAGYHVPKPMLDRLSRFLIPLRGYRFVEEAWEYRRPFHSSDPGSDPGIDRSMLDEFPCRSLLFVPMIVKGEPIGGLLTTWQARSHEFHAEELRLVEGISHQAALALDNARLFASQQEEAEISGALLNLAEAVSGVQNLEDVLDTVARITPQLLGRKRCGLFLFDPTDRVLIPTVSWGLDDDLKPAFQELRGELRIPAVIRAAESKRPVVVEEATLDAMIPRTVVSALYIRAMLIIPLLSGGRVMGMMAVDSPGESRTFTSKDIAIAQGIAAHAADAIQRNRMMAELRAMSLVDELTGLYNRRGFFVLARQHLKIADRARRGMLLVFVDLDRLKFINDRLGHREGDQALVNAARILKETFRESDVIARIGGDEFAVLTIDAGPDSAALLARRLRERLDALNAGEDRGYRLSVSAGVTRYDPDAPCSVDDLLSRADAAMYGDKRGGER